MIKVYVTKQSNYPIAAKAIKDCLKTFFVENGVVSDAMVYVAVVGEAKMKDYGKRYLGESKNAPVHSVLSFTASEAKKEFVYPPDGNLYLGEIVICYPKVVEEATVEGKLIEVKALELVEHGGLHLLGVHHE